MNSVALVTGIRPYGIGAATSHQLAVHQRFKVIACDRIVGLGQEAVDEIRRAGGEIYFTHADVSQSEDVSQLVDWIAERFGHLDVLVNNAGDARTPSEDNLLSLGPEAFMAIVDANLGSAYRVTQAAVKRFMQPQGRGVCIFLGSVNGSLGACGQLAYGCSKTALIGLVKILSAQFARTGIRFNLVQPGPIETNSENWRKRRKIDAEWAQKEGRANPIGRLGRPEDVAQLIGFLASEASSFVNGAQIAIDGGLMSSGILVPGFNPAGDFRLSYKETVDKLLAAQAKELRQAA